MAKLIPSSLTGRLFLVSMLVILLFLPLAGLVLEQAYNNSLDRRLQEQLKIQSYGLMGLADELEPGKLWLPEVLPDERFNQLSSGLYAKVSNSHGETIWQSQSSLNIQFPVQQPPTISAGAGQFIFNRIDLTNSLLAEAVEVTIIWEGPDETENRYTFTVVEDLTPYLAEKSAFRDTILYWLGGLGLFLLTVNAAALFWALRPLKKLAEEIQQVERGDIQTLQTKYPTELNQVANNLNLLINHEQQQRIRYRNTLQDLAHSLKTPLSVIQASTGKLQQPELKELFDEHISRMSNIISYQLSRAVTSGASPVRQKVKVREIVTKIFTALSKVYNDKNLSFKNEVSQDCLFFGDENDLLEIVGNLCDNACKYGHSLVMVKSLIAIDESNLGNTEKITLRVIDDGKGIPENLKQVIFKRGKRLDETSEGQGIGLSVVSDIVESYKGKIDFISNQSKQNIVQVILPGKIENNLA